MIGVIVFGLLGCTMSLCMAIVWLGARLSLPDWCAGPLALGMMALWAGSLAWLGYTLLL